MNIIVFDVDETLGAFSEFSEFCRRTIGTKNLTYKLFSYLLNNNPVYLQPNIIAILEYIKLHKEGKKNRQYFIDILQEQQEIAIKWYKEYKIPIKKYNIIQFQRKKNYTKYFHSN